MLPLLSWSRRVSESFSGKRPLSTGRVGARRDTNGIPANLRIPQSTVEYQFAPRRELSADERRSLVFALAALRHERQRDTVGQVQRSAWRGILHSKQIECAPAAIREGSRPVGDLPMTFLPAKSQQTDRDLSMCKALLLCILRSMSRCEVA